MTALSVEQRNYLQAIYFDPAHPASYQSPYHLYKFVRKDGRYNLKLKDIQKWLKNQETYSLNKNVLRNFQRGRVLVIGIDDQWEADLASLEAYAHDNDGYKYLFCVMDVFSRYAWIKPLKTKEAREIVEIFGQILLEGRKPRRLRTDAAKDFTSKVFQNFIKTKNISHFTTHSEKQANYIERFIQTIKRKIFRYIVGSNNPRYIDKLQDFVSSYNKSFHSGIQSEPVNVTKENENKLWWQMYWPKDKTRVKRDKKKRKKRVSFTFAINDKVRISHIRSAFQREYSARWTIELFKVKERFIRQGQPIYKINDWDGEPVAGTFYSYELQKVDEPPVWKIQEVLKYKGRGRNKQVLVSWKGWPKKFNSWIPASNIEQL